jgi:AmmeMemoRadiSam system protein A
MNLTAGQQSALLDLARASLRSALTADPPPAPPNDPDFAQLAGCFVCLHEIDGHRLRGCVGRIEAKAPLGQTVAAMARAVLEDPRFVTHPVRLHELPDLDIELSILSPLAAASHPFDFDPRQDGIYLTYGDRTGCFLPQVARETGWGRQELLEHLCMEKMELPAVTWRHPAARLERFTTTVIGPEPVVPRASAVR